MTESMVGGWIDDLKLHGQKNGRFSDPKKKKKKSSNFSRIGDMDGWKDGIYTLKYLVPLTQVSYEMAKITNRSVVLILLILSPNNTFVFHLWVPMSESQFSCLHENGKKNSFTISFNISWKWTKDAIQENDIRLNLP